MDTVTEADMAQAVGESGGLGVIHRFLPIDEQADMVSSVGETYGVPAAGAVGIAGPHLDRAEALVEATAALVEAITEYAGPVQPRLAEFCAGIRSGLSYGGGHDLETARENAEFVEIRKTTERNSAHGFPQME